MNEFLLTLNLILLASIVIYFSNKHYHSSKENNKAIKLLEEEKNNFHLKNESFAFAKEQNQYFSDKIRPLFSELILELSFNKSLFFDKHKVTIYGETVILTVTEKLNNDDIEGIIKSKYLKLLINSLESYSMHFTNGISSEQIGFLNSGEEYCEIVKKIAPILVPEFSKGNYLNIKKLLVMWHLRSSKETITVKRRIIRKKINN
jgi:hypothetical protein